MKESVNAIYRTRVAKIGKRILIVKKDKGKKIADPSEIRVQTLERAVAHLIDDVQRLQSGLLAVIDVVKILGQTGKE